MSTVKADNFTWKSGEMGGQPQYTVTADKIILGTAKVWCNYNTQAPSIRSSFNISSITKTSTGDYTANFNISIIDINYSFIGTCSDIVYGGNLYLYSPAGTDYYLTTGTTRFLTRSGYNTSPALTDPIVTCFSVNR